ncbi:MAG: L-2-amino-thiazoline-4-carboxylic acid hydrolase [Planctomycetota bacterium]
MGYSESQKSKLLKDFDATASLMRDYLVERYGQDFAGTLSRDARQEYERIIPEVPRIRGMRARALNSFLLITAQEVAVYKAMKKHGKGSSEAWEICHEALQRRMERFPAIKRWILKRLMYSRFLMRRVRKRTEKQEQFKFGDFEIRYLIGDGAEFDWGVDYVGCGNYNLAKKLGAEEFAPYVCMSDIALGNALEWGLIRTQTLADGCEFCDFRFKRGSNTKISSKTPEVQATIERIQRS